MSRAMLREYELPAMNSPLGIARVKLRFSLNQVEQLLHDAQGPALDPAVGDADRARFAVLAGALNSIYLTLIEEAP
jgi:hypothetical protein